MVDDDRDQMNVQVLPDRPDLVMQSVVLREQARITREETEVTRAQAAAARQDSQELLRQIDTLKQALETRTEIATAIGLLMARENISSDDAFTVLRRASQRTNRKLRDIAVEMLAAHHGRIGAGTDQPPQTA
jgi:hypothetical protein